MKLSMWMIVDRLEEYDPQYDIADGGAHIMGVRFISKEDAGLEKQYVYLALEAEGTHGGAAVGTTMLTNGEDVIILHSRDVNGILNDLLAAFEYYNSWEAALWGETASGSLQRALDIGGSTLKNPMMLSDADGFVLAMSSAYRNDDLNEFWVEARTTGHVPIAILGSPLQKHGDAAASAWTGAPAVYTMPDGTTAIGASVSIDGEDVAAFGLWEHEKPINPGDVQLARTLCAAFASIIGGRRRGNGLRSSADIIGDLLAGTEIDAELLGKLELRCANPWQLIVIGNPYRSDAYYTRRLLRSLREHETPCIPLIHEECVIALVSEADAIPLLDSTLGERERSCFAAGISMPFDDLRLLPVRYEQMRFALNSADGAPGVYYSEDSAFGYLLSLLGKKSQRQCLSHPALAKLRTHDLERGSELYETLYQYLLTERAILPGAEALHIHRNSFMYRLHRIKDVANINLEDPATRMWLLLSYFMEKL